MNLEGKKISGSRNWAIYVNDFLNGMIRIRYDIIWQLTCPNLRILIGIGKTFWNEITMNWLRLGVTWQIGLFLLPTSIGGRFPIREHWKWKIKISLIRSKAALTVGDIMKPFTCGASSGGDHALGNGSQSLSRYRRSLATDQNGQRSSRPENIYGSAGY